MACSAPEAPQHPNIVFVIADDMGIGDTSAYQDWTGNPDSLQIHTPAMDRLARMGVRFTGVHTSSTVCTPTRYALLTGRYFWRTWLKHQVIFADIERPLIEIGRPTLPLILRAAGYRTAIVGKWHVGLAYSDKNGRMTEDLKAADLRQPVRNGPLDHGFDYAFYTARTHNTSSR